MHFCTKLLIVITVFCSFSMELKQPNVSYILNKINNSEEGTNSRADPLSKNVEGLEKLLSETEALNQTEKIYNVEHLVKSNGYPIETHYVTTGDGYILRVHRIPSSPKTNASNGKVAFLQHGILCSAADWVITGSEKGLGFLLADAGYDVWMGNARGNTWSRNHTTLNPDKDANFWKFSFHEIGFYDLPAMIDYALEKTGASSVYYVGHSQGTTAYYVMVSELPAYNSKIKMAANLAPIAFLKHMTSPLFQIMALFEPMGNFLANLIGINEFMPSSNFFKYLIGNKICAEDSVTEYLCTNALFAFCGFDYAQLNKTLLPFIMKYTPAGGSTRQFFHYGQAIHSGHFRPWSYGIIGNLEKYGSFSPPDYNLSNIIAPTYLFWSFDDWLSAEVDVKRLCAGMGAACEMIKIPEFYWNHLDYIYGIDVRTYVNDPVINLFNSK